MLNTTPNPCKFIVIAATTAAMLIAQAAHADDSYATYMTHPDGYAKDHGSQGSSANVSKKDNSTSGLGWLLVPVAIAILAASSSGSKKN